jgi:hypothetical protein
MIRTLVPLVCLICLARIGVAEPLKIQACDRLMVVVHDPAEREFAQRLADSTCQRLSDLGHRFGASLGPIQVHMLADMAGWRKRSGRAWYIVAALAGDRILTQPARSLRKLEAPMRPVAHELAHAFIHHTAGRNCPRWLDEGLAQWLAGDKRAGTLPKDSAALEGLEARLKTPDRDRSTRRNDYATSRAVVRKLIQQVGETVMLESLSDLRAGVAPLELDLRGRSLGDRLFAGRAQQRADTRGKQSRQQHN